ncbi:MAG: hypothetical protein AAGC92_14850 [Pseudomonadota bacterium]
MSVVAIVSAGVLVRLARGVPFSAIDVLKADEARKLSSAIKQSVRGLRALLAVCFFTILVLVFADKLAGLLSTVTAQELLPFTDHLDYLALGVPLLLTFVIMRTFAVVEGDIEVADIQADILVKKRGKDLADEFQKGVADKAKDGYRQPSGYGGAV